MHYRLVMLLPLLLWAGEDRLRGSEMELLSRVQQRMGENLERLPNYTCLATIERTVRRGPKKKPLLEDRIRLEAASVGPDELFSWPGSAEFGTVEALRIAPGGAGRLGGWSAWSRRVLRSTAPNFTYAGGCAAEGRHGMRFDFQVPWSGSAYTFDSGTRHVVLPSGGSLCADPESADVIRLEVRAEPGKLPLAGITETVDYGRARVGDAEFLLPRSHEQVVTDLEGNEGRTRTTLSACRPYTKGASAPGDTKPVLPANVTLELKLETPITYEQSAAGDRVTARMDYGIRAAGISVPKGALASGRIRCLEQRYHPEKHFVVGLEFSTVSFGDAQVSFRARLVGPKLRYERRPDSVDGRSLYNPPAPIIDVLGLEIDDSEPTLPYGVFRVRATKLNLTPGMRMTWRTQEE
jgi:hypothetical protein